MRAIVALGNPGATYADTRHNAGFLLADALAAWWALPRLRDAGPALLSGGTVQGEAVILVKPQTYMNRSGEAVRPLLVRGLEPERELLVVCDDLALPLGTFRIRARGSSGGHNGLESIEAALGSRDYARLRIGIGPKPDAVHDQADWVLAPLTPHERAAVDELMPAMCEAVDCWIAEGVEVAMNRFNRRGTESE